MTFYEWVAGVPLGYHLTRREITIASAAWSAALESAKKQEVKDEDFERLWKLAPKR